MINNEKISYSYQEKDENYHGPAEVNIVPSSKTERGSLFRVFFNPYDGLDRVSILLPFEMPLDEKYSISIFDEEHEIIKSGTFKVVANFDGCSILIGVC